MKKLLLLMIVVVMAGCSAGNLSINGQEAFRVSDCTMTNEGVVTFTEHGQKFTVSPQHALFEKTLFHSDKTDVCDETGVFCGGE